MTKTKMEDGRWRMEDGVERRRRLHLPSILASYLESCPDASSWLTSPTKESSSASGSGRGGRDTAPAPRPSAVVSMSPPLRSTVGPSTLPALRPLVFRVGGPEAISRAVPVASSGPGACPPPPCETPLPPVPTPTMSVSMSPPLLAPGPEALPPTPARRPSPSPACGCAAPGSLARVFADVYARSVVLDSLTPKSLRPPNDLAALESLPTFPLGFTLGPFLPRLPPCACLLAMVYLL